MVSPSAVVLTDFDYFWQLYPRRTGKGAARRKFEQALKTTTAIAIMQALAAQIAAGMFSPDPKFIAHPATWLHQERYDDEVVMMRPTLRNGAMAALLEMQEQGTLLEYQGDD
jgi:hypothetical protein